MVSELPDTPAKTNFKTGKLYLSYELWDKMPIEQQAFVLFHEMGHWANRSNSEFTADEYAIRMFARYNLPLSASINAAIGHLDERDPFHVRRANRILQLAKRYDSGYTALNKEQISMVVQKALQTAQGKRAPFIYQDQEGREAEFLGLGKKARKRRKAKRAVKHERKLEKIAARGSIREKVAAAGGGIGKGLSNALSGILGQGADPTFDDPSGDNGGTPPSESNNSLIIGIVVVVVVVAVFFWLKNRKK